MDKSDFGASLVIAIARNIRGELIFPVVYSEQEEGVHRRMYWKFPAGCIEEKDFPEDTSTCDSPQGRLERAALCCARREFIEETSIPESAITEIELLSTVRGRNDHVLYVHLAAIDPRAALPAAGTAGSTGELVSYLTPQSLLSERDFLPAHKKLYQDLIVNQLRAKRRR